MGLATSKLVTTARKKADENDKNGENGEYPETKLAQVSCIRYLITFWKKFILALFNLRSKVSVIHLTFTIKLGLSIQPTDINAQKINDTMLNTYEMVVAVFSMTDQANQVRYFQKTFLVANISFEVVLRIAFSHFK